MTSKLRQQLYEKKQLERMQKAREEKQRKNAIFERGEPAPLKNAVAATTKFDQSYSNINNPTQNQPKAFNERKLGGPYGAPVQQGRYPYHR